MDEGFFPFAEFARLDSQDRAFIIRSINSQAEVVHGADDSFPFEGFLKLSDEARESIIEEIKKQNSGNSKTKSGFQSVSGPISFHSLPYRLEHKTNLRTSQYLRPILAPLLP